jgi:hypothetical protein
MKLPSTATTTAHAWHYGRLKICATAANCLEQCLAQAALAIRLERARFSPTPIDILTMLAITNPVPWLLGIIALGAILFSMRRHFSPETRERRRREKSHRPVISRKQGPTVRLAVKAGKPKRDRQG